MPSLYSMLSTPFAGLIALLAVAPTATAMAQDEPDQEADDRQVVVLTDSQGFVHSVVKPVDGDSLVVRTLRSIVTERLDGSILHISDAAELDEEILDPAKTSVVVMYTTADIPLDVELFNKYIENGGALLGIHCATDTLMTTPAFTDCIGGIFDGHPWNADTPVVLKAVDRRHPIIEPVGDRRALKEEIYQIKEYKQDEVRTLMVLDMEATELKRPQLVPVTWCRNIGEGRVVYTSLGHREDVWQSDWFQDHLTAALRWATGRIEGSAEPNPRIARREHTLARQAAANDARPSNQDAERRRTNQQRAGAQAANAAAVQVETDDPGEAGDDGQETALFNGTEESAREHWRGFKKEELPDGWTIDEGSLHRADGGGDIITKEKFRNFDLTLEWKVAEGGNSGIFYLVAEEGEHTQATYTTGLEMQVLDDERHPDAKAGRDRWAGALYDLLDVPDPSPANPAGEWNTARVVFKDGHIRHFLNGEVVADIQMGSDEWKEQLAGSKFSDWPRFARESEGHIGLQDHGDKVWFRNIRIKRLD